jgi:hypothetical protein
MTILVIAGGSAIAFAVQKAPGRHPGALVEMAGPSIRRDGVGSIAVDGAGAIARGGLANLGGRDHRRWKASARRPGSSLFERLRVADVFAFDHEHDLFGEIGRVVTHTL